MGTAAHASGCAAQARWALRLTAAAAAVVVASSAAGGGRRWTGEDAVGLADLHIGTGGWGFGVGGSPPGAQLPFGMVRASPDTCDKFGIALSFTHFGGYHYKDTHIAAFTHTHMVGPGVQDWGNIGFMPWAGSGPVSKRDVFGGAYRSAFSHDDEVARPGVYSAVLMDAGDARVEVVPSAGPQAVSYEVAWPAAAAGGAGTTTASQTRAFLFDLGTSLPKGSVLASHVTVSVTALGNVSITGHAQQNGPLTERNHKGGVVVYFAASIKLPAVGAIGVWSTQADKKREFERSPGSSSSWANGTEVGAFVELPPSVDGAATTVRVTLALSMISVDQAVANLAAQVGSRSHAECAAIAGGEWAKLLGRFQVTTPDDGDGSDSGGAGTSWQDEVVKFYSAAYHALMAPTTYSESNGAYLGFDGKVHTVVPTDGPPFMSDMSIWDIFRCQVPLIALVLPSRASAIGKSLLLMKEQGGDIPRWPIATVYSGCMIGTHAGVILADLGVKNLLSASDISASYSGMRAAVTSQRANAGRDGWQVYDTLGYIPKDGYTKAASCTLAYALDDAAIGTLASLAGNASDAAFFTKRSKSTYKNIWHEESEYFCPKYRNGTWACNLNPAFHEWMFGDDGFCEGDAAEWRWFVPHDLPGLVSLFSSPESYAEKLDDFFNRTYCCPETELPNPHYWAGNEPDILEPWQFVAAGRPDLTQRHTRRVMQFAYSTMPDGMPGNDDYGALSSWYVWAALGLYPLAGSTTYVLGSPTFPEVVVTFETGHALTVVAHNASADNVYVERVQVNGKPVTDATVDHADIAKGGTLEYWMADRAPLRAAPRA